MAIINAFPAAAIVCLSALLSAAGPVDAHPQQLFGQQQQQQQQQYQPLTEVCLGCICEAISSCNQTLMCEGDVCGVFRITWAYWYDSGKPVLPGDNPNDAHAHVRCLNNPDCAKKSAIGYLTRFAQDCNHDGVVDCLDYASIHKLGGYGCSAPLNVEYKEKFDKCQNDVYHLSGSIGQDNNNAIFSNNPQADIDLRSPFTSESVRPTNTVNS